MPEEINRIVADHLSTVLFCPSETATANLSREGITQNVHMVGDIMAEGLRYAVERADRTSTVMHRLGVRGNSYLLGTVHRAENTDNPDRLRDIVKAFCLLKEPLVFPVHPRTRARIAGLGDEINRTVQSSMVNMVDPVGYLDMVALEKSARMILTDSGGIQKEAYWLGIPCVTLREEIEWVETVQSGWNTVVGADAAKIVESVTRFQPPRVAASSLFRERCRKDVH